MFEQSSYEPTTAAEPATEKREGDLFKNYELRTWDLSPRLYKILGMSAAANVLALLIVAQTSLLTMKGCDSPLVGSVCQALDTVYVGAMLFGTQREYVDQEYDKIDLGNSEITYLDYTGVEPQFTYPGDYFKLANPEQQVATQMPGDPLQSLTPGFPNFSTPGSPMPRPNMGNNMLNTPPNYPKPRKNVVEGPLPSGVNDNTVADNNPGANRRKPGNGNSSNNTGTNSGNPTLDNTNGSTEPKTTTDANGEPIINKRPFVDLGNKVNDMLDKNEVKLDSAFIVNASGKLTKDGKLDEKSFRWGEVKSQDTKMIEVIQDSVNAINASGYLTYLSGLSGKDFKLMMQQDDLNITAIVQSEMESDTRARSIKSSLDLAISVAKMRKNSASADQNDKDDLILLENAKIDLDGKKIIIRFVVPKEIALPMIQRKLAEQKLAPKQPNGNAVVKPNVNVGK